MSTPPLPLLRAYAAEQRQALPEHPTPDELLDYHLGDVTPEQRERIQDHLALCPDCTRAVLDFVEFPNILPAGVRSADMDAAWVRLRERTFAAAPAAVRQPRASRRRASAMSLIAASLLVASLVGYQIGKIGSAPEGQPFTPLLIEEETERSVSGPEEIRVPDSVRGPLPLILLPQDTEGFTRFDVEILQFGQPRWRQTGLRAGPNGQINIYVPRDLPSGPSVIRLYGVGEGEPTQLMEQLVDIEWEGRPD